MNPRRGQIEATLAEQILFFPGCGFEYRVIVVRPAVGLLMVRDGEIEGAAS